MWALQGMPLRHAYMQILVKLECDRSRQPVNILEIGTWAGGSAITWAEAIKKFNHGKGRLICIDSWVPYLDSSQQSDDNSMVYKEMTDALSKGKIYQLYEHNIKSSKHNDLILSFKGFSNDILPVLGDGCFNIVFIDGNHNYSSVAKDIKNSVRLVCEGGILCGDDLELQIHEIDLENAKKNCEIDYILDPKTNQQYHPGVTLAVGEFFGDVSSWEGFWAMQKCGDKWKKMELPELLLNDIVIPVHLTDVERTKFQTQVELEQLRSQLQKTQAEIEILYAGYRNPTFIESIEGYNIVAWQGKYYGLPQKLGAVDIIADDISELKGVFIDISIKRLKQLIQNYLGLISEIERSHLEIERSHLEIEQLQSQIQVIESTKFWKLRSVWLRLKGTIGLKGK
jgi:predicted O-methyltransferase YrrM